MTIQGIKLSWGRMGLICALGLSVSLAFACQTTGSGTRGGGNGKVTTKSKFTVVQGEKAPAFSLRDLKGRTHTLGQYQKKVVLLNFWATWCEPCKKEFPHFQRFLNSYKSKGLEILAVSVDEARAQSEVGPTIYRFGYNFTVLLDAEGRVVSLYNPKRHCPYSVLIDRKGQIRWRHQGYHPGDEKALETKIQSLLKE